MKHLISFLCITVVIGKHYSFKIAALSNYIKILKPSIINYG